MLLVGEPQQVADIFLCSPTRGETTGKVLRDRSVKLLGHLTRVTLGCRLENAILYDFINYGINMVQFDINLVLFGTILVIFDINFVIILYIFGTFWH